jgi:hypothetical protein
MVAGPAAAVKENQSPAAVATIPASSKEKGQNA